MWKFLLFKYIYVSKEISGRDLQPTMLLSHLVRQDNGSYTFPHSSHQWSSEAGWDKGAGRGMALKMLQREKWNYVKPVRAG